jgi:hypothetical protein
MPFQAQVNSQQAPAVAGDFASDNPRASVVAPEGGFVCGAGGINVATFGWVQADGKTVLNSAASGAPNGFVSRQEQALIGTYLAEYGVNIPAGFPLTLMAKGDYWFKALNNAAVVGQQVFAKLADGSIQTGTTGSPPAGYVATPFYVSQACNQNELGIMSA